MKLFTIGFKGPLLSTAQQFYYLIFRAALGTIPTKNKRIRDDLWVLPFPAKHHKVIGVSGSVLWYRIRGTVILSILR
jgi:hypothetical protein